MAWRTNKMWILKKKKQLEKIKLIKSWWKRWLKNKSISPEEKIQKWLIFDKENSVWNTFSRDKSWRKIICNQTWLREDFNGYRLLFKANSNEIIYKFTWWNSQLRKKINKTKKC